MGYKGAGSVKLECNKASYETIQVERVENGLVHFKGGNETFIGNMISEGVRTFPLTFHMSNDKYSYF